MSGALELARFDGEAPELDWLDAALGGEPRAVLWQAARGIVVPLSYQRDAQALERACGASADRGWPVRLRRSGGGAVPQGAGIVNLSLAYPLAGTAGTHAEAVYARLCRMLAGALARFGVEAEAAEVRGSFCDGRFNLAVAGRKIAGTAQYWRRRGDAHAVLAHALLIADADPAAITEPLNRFEADLGSARRYDPSVITSIAAEAGAPVPLDALHAAIQSSL